MCVVAYVAGPRSLHVGWARSWLRKTRRETRGAVDRPVNDQLLGVNFALEQHLAGLSLPMREVVVFRYLFDLSTAQTAGMLDVPEGTEKSYGDQGSDHLLAAIDDS